MESDNLLGASSPQLHRVHEHIPACTGQQQELGTAHYNFILVKFRFLLWIGDFPPFLLRIVRSYNQLRYFEKHWQSLCFEPRTSSLPGSYSITRAMPQPKENFKNKLCSSCLHITQFRGCGYSSQSVPCDYLLCLSCCVIGWVFSFSLFCENIPPKKQMLPINKVSPNWES